MGTNPFIDESLGSQANTLIDQFAYGHIDRPVADVAVAVGRPARQLCVYAARNGYDLQPELDFLANRVMEPNVFFTGRFLAPAMPRLEDRQVRLLLIRDETAKRSRMRLLMPFSVERPGFSLGPSVIRVWSHPFGPVGTPLVDAEDAAETIDNLLEALERPAMRLPSVLLLPDQRLRGPTTELIRAVAIARGLPVAISARRERPMLQSKADADTYLAGAMSPEDLREMDAQWGKLEDKGTLTYTIARSPADVYYALEDFLALEASGWKGRRRTAMVADRYRAAFAREAVTNLSETDNVRIHSLQLDGQTIATAIVFVMSGDAYTWKTAYDETYSDYAPDRILFRKLTENHLDDPNIQRTDSCAVPDHPVAGRLWQERIAMGTLIVGLRADSDRDVRKVTRQLHLYRNTRNLARLLRERFRLFGRGKSEASGSENES